jgi:hypothetical protein
MEVFMNNLKGFITLAVMTIVKTGTKLVDNDNYTVYENAVGDRYIHGKNSAFNMYFRKSDGFTAKWGKNFNDDPAFNPYGNEIADIEITKKCRGIRVFDENSSEKNGNRVPCAFCYKSSSPIGSYMNFETFKKIFDVMNESKTMTQIAFGVDAEASEELNPDIWKIFEYTKNNGVTPNVTVADITTYTAEKIVSLCGACAVSAYQSNKNCCYDSIRLLLDEAKKQGKENFAVNIHLMISKETLPFVYEVINDYQIDRRLDGMNAIVFLSLKQKGRGEHFNKVTEDEFKNVIDICFEKNVKFGMDSCSANKFLKAIEGKENFNELSSMVENCESVLYSTYVNADGKMFPCSFMEKEGDWKDGIDVTKVENFVNDVWYSEPVKKYREASLKCIECNGCNECPYYDV